MEEKTSTDEESLEHIQDLINNNLTRYSTYSDDPKYGRYYATSLCLTKAEMLLVKKAIDAYLA